MKKFKTGSLVVILLAMISCGKENPPVPAYASVLYVNAAVTPTTAPASSLYLNDSLYSNGIVLYNASTGYLGVLPGSHVLKVKQEAIPPAQPVTIAVDPATTFNVNEAYTLVSYDTLTGGNIKVMKLRDDLSVPDVNSAKVRFWQLAPVFPVAAIDVTYLRTATTPATTPFTPDSVTIANRTYPGANPVISNFETFTTIPAGVYTLKFKVAGTQTVVTSVAGVTIGRRKIYSHYLTGNTQGRALAFGQIVHF